MDPKPIVLDASLLIALAKAGHLSLLFDTTELDLYVTPTVLGELRKPETRRPIDQAIAAGRLQLLRITSDDAAELEAIADWLERVDEGEAEVIGVAVTRGWLIGLEDRGARNLLRRQGRASACIGSVELLLLAIRAGRLSLQEADSIFSSLDVYPGYSKRGVRSIGHFLEDRKT